MKKRKISKGKKKIVSGGEKISNGRKKIIIAAVIIIVILIGVACYFYYKGISGNVVASMDIGGESKGGFLASLFKMIFGR